MAKATREQASEAGGRGNITDAARRKGAESKIHRGIFNRYIKALQGPQVDRVRAQIAEIDAMLARGTRLKKAPVFENGTRVGTTERELPLLPSEMAIWMAKRSKLEAGLKRRAPDDLRQEFLRILPQYAVRHDLTRDILLAVGVPEDDLDEAGITD